jgi:flagellar hook-associated protein 3 FlgL
MSSRITTGMVQRNVLADLNRVSARLTRTQEKISSNREITKPSDDPFNASRALQLRESLDSTQQYQRNVQDATGWQETSEQAFSQITSSLAKVRELLVQGSSDSADTVSREAIAKEVDQIISGIKESANATYQGRYVFSGTKTDQSPYPLPEPVAPANPDGFQGSPQQIERQIGPGVTMEVSVSIAGVLGGGQAAADGGILDTLRGISAHLRAGDGPTLRGADLGALDTNLDALLGVRALNGARQNRLDSALNRLFEVEESTLTQLSETEDADIAKTLIDFNSQQAAYQAALKAGASIVQASLMDFLR